MKPILLSALLALGACTGSSVLEQSQTHERFGEHVKAYRVLDSERQRLLDAGLAVEPELERAWIAARLRFLLERGRYYIFHELDDEALVALAGALAIDPDNAEAVGLRKRALEKKVARFVAEGRRLLAERQLEGALAAFLEAERVMPTSKAALDGQAEVRAEFDRLTTAAQRQFLEAVRKMPEFRYVEVRWHSSNALVNDPDRADAEAIRRRARREIALVTMQRGRDYQAQDQFGAALIEFKAAKDLYDSVDYRAEAAADLAADLPGIDAAIAEVERELEAGKLAGAAQMFMRRREFDEAEAALEKAHEMSVMLRGSISELMIENRRLRGERDYERAHDFEIQGMMKEALEAYVALSAEWPDGLRDEKARIDGLQSDIATARKEWELAEAAEEAGRLEEALEHYLTSERFYARMADAKQRIARLRARLGSEAEGGRGGS